MKQVLTAAILAAGLAVFGGGAGAAELRVPVSLTSFGAAQAISSYRMSAAGLALGPAQTHSTNSFAGAAVVLPVTFGGAQLPQSFAASTALSINLALDAGYNLNLAQRFSNYSALQSPLLDQTSYLDLANGGRYAGITYAPQANLRLRLGGQFKNDRLDSFTFDPIGGSANLLATVPGAQQQSFLGGASWSFADWGGLEISGIVNRQNGLPLGLNPATSLSPQSTVQTSALNVSAHVDFAGGWVTTAAFSEGLAQLDQKNSAPASVQGQSYSIAIAKHGVFGQDAVGFSLSRPSASLIGNNFVTLSASGDLPPVLVANGMLPGTAPETDLQLGYVTSFLDGALALQANAAYQMNYQGQTGATSLAILSRAKIKF